MEHDSADALAKQVDTLLGKSDTSSHQRFATIVDAVVAVDLEHRYDDLHAAVGNGGDDAESESENKPAKKQKS